MKQFLSILLRNQFNLYYRFGYTFVPNSELVEFDGTVSEEVKDKLVKKFATTTPFEYDEEYLILHLDKEAQSDSDFTQFDIQNIVAVYPLSKQAKVSIESKIDQRINLEDPVFESILPSIETEIQKKEVEKAIAALWTICEFEESLDKYLSEIGLETILRGLEHRRTATKAAQIVGGSYWEYLIAYDRYDYFPNSNLGYLYDAGQVFAYSRGDSTFEGSGIHRFLEKANSKKPEIKLSQFEKYFETEEMLKGYVSLTTVGEIKQYMIAPLYLMIRDDIRRQEDLYETSLFKHLDYLKEFGNSFNYVVILLGAFFGFRKFYDVYYNNLNLRFYKEYKAKKDVADKSQQNQTVEPEQEILDVPTKNAAIATSDILKDPKIEEEGKTQKTTIVSIINSEDENDEESDRVSQYRNIIREVLIERREIKMSEMAEIIKDRIGGRKLLVRDLKNVVKEMSDMRIDIIDGSKGIKKAEQVGYMFSNDNS